MKRWMKVAFVVAMMLASVRHADACTWKSGYAGECNDSSYIWMQSNASQECQTCKSDAYTICSQAPDYYTCYAPKINRCNSDYWRDEEAAYESFCVQW